MMTTTYPGMQNPGMQHGHPMGAPGPNPGHPGMAQAMQMHPGASGPGGPASQAGPMMAGMPPGVAPSAHALSHLQPQQQHMFQQQHMQMNPQMMQQRNAQAQHQAFIRQQQQLLQQQHQQQNGMGMGFPGMGGNMNPQQLAAMQGNMGQPFVNLPQHLRQQMQQQQMQHQQQQATSNPQAQAMAHAQAQAAQAAQQAHAQQQHQLQQQHVIAMQHAQSQSSNHSQSGSQGPPTTSQPQQAPLRPPSAIGSHQGQSSPAPQPTPQQQPQPGPQPQQQQTPVQNQPQNVPQQPNQQPPAQPMQQRNPALAQAQQAQVQVQAQAAAQAQAQATRLAMMQKPQGGQGTLKLLNFVDQLSKFSTSRGVNAIDYWQSFVARFFTESGSFLHTLFSDQTGGTKMFEIVYGSLPRYFYTQFNTDVENLHITIDGATEKNSPSETKVTCDRAKFIYTYKGPCPIQVVCRGKLTAFWAGSDKMEWLQFEMEEHSQYLQRSALESLFSQPSPSQMSQTQSPRMNKSTAKQRQQQRLQQPETLEPMMKRSELPVAKISDMGIPMALQSYLEIYETMNNMTNLINHYQDNPQLNPSQAMVNWVQAMSTGPAMAQQHPGANQPQGGNMPNQMAMQPPPQGMQPGSRTPNGPGHPGGPQFMSPAMNNALLPNGITGSPHLMGSQLGSHTSSPASGGHQMVHSHSQQGANVSQNTSPNVSNKRRRSTAKIEGDDGGGPEINGTQKVKPSPRMGGNKRIKGNN